MGEIKTELNQEEIIIYYSRKEVQQEICRSAQDREIGVRYSGGGFAKRPDILQYPQDVIQMIKSGGIAFNISEERWYNPLDLRPGMKQSELDANRQGWDLILDIDCNFLEISKIAAKLITKALEHYRVEYSIKFSGRSGFHIAVAWESFPETVNNKETRMMFPEIPRAVAEYLKEMIAENLGEQILNKISIDEIQKKSGKAFEELAPKNKFNPFSLVDIDSVAISSRHLIRSVYSINEKTGLVSVPLIPEELADFDISLAATSKVDVAKDIAERRIFLERKEGNKTGLKNLFVQALDFAKKIGFESPNEEKEFEMFEEAAGEESFPPCIKHILKGISDGRKRASFIIVNFLSSCGWTYDMIESRLKSWNQILSTPLKETELFAALRQHKKKKSIVLPPNCNNKAYYVDLGICNPDNLCKKIKNPVSYVRFKENVKKLKPDEGKKSKLRKKDIAKGELDENSSTKRRKKNKP